MYRGYAVLMEYRLAKLGVENALTLCGTPEYMAPEQVIKEIWAKQTCEETSLLCLECYAHRWLSRLKMALSHTDGFFTAG